MSRTGRVSIVGAGPGAPDLVTVRGLRRLRDAETVLYDRLVDPLLVAEAPAAAEKIFVGKEPEDPGVGQEGIHALMIDRARAGLHVVRLKGGDPFVFGRGVEEAIALARAGVPFEVVPGLSSTLAVPAHAGIPMTHRGVARSFAVITGHLAGDSPAVSAGAVGADTVVVLMGATRLAEIAADLQHAGRTADTPVAVIERGTTPHERVIEGSLHDIAARARDAGLQAPAVVVVGEVAMMRLAIRDHQPAPIPRRAEVCR